MKMLCILDKEKTNDRVVFFFEALCFQNRGLWQYVGGRGAQAKDISFVTEMQSGSNNKAHLSQDILLKFKPRDFMLQVEGLESQSSSNMHFF